MSSGLLLLCNISTEIIVTRVNAYKNLTKPSRNDDDNNLYFASWRFNAHNSFWLSSAAGCLVDIALLPVSMPIHYVCASLCGKLLCSIIFLEAAHSFRSNTDGKASDAIPVQCQIKKKYYHKTVASQCCAQRALKRQLIFMPSTPISYMKTSFGFSFGGGKNAAFIHRVLPSFYNCSLSSLLLLCVHLSPFHNKQTRQSMKSTATTEKSDKRNVMKYIFRLFFPRLSVFIAFAASCNCIQCPNMETIPHFLYDNDTKTMSEHQQRIVRE